MPILDKLNKKLDEAGVEEHGRTIEEAVDLLPAMGGSGGLQLEQIGTTHNCNWFVSGQGMLNVTYYRIGGEGSPLFAIRIKGSGNNVSLPTSEFKIDANPNVVPLSDGYFTGLGYMCTNEESGKGRIYVAMHKAQKGLYTLPDKTETKTGSSFDAFFLVIGELADNIT